MNVLLVAPHYPPTFVAGVELYTRRLATHLTARGHRCSVVAIERLGGPSDVVDSDTRVEEGVTVHRLRVPGMPAPAGTPASYDDPRLRAWLTTHLDAHRPDVLHLHSGYLTGGAVLGEARTRRVPTVVTLHDYWFICPRVTLQHPDGSPCTGPESATKCAWCLGSTRRRVRVPARLLGARGRATVAGVLEREPVAGWTGWRARLSDITTRRTALLSALESADRVLSPSCFLLEMLASAGVPRERMRLHRHGAEPRRAVGPRTDGGPRLRIGFLGQIAAHKGVHVLIEAVRSCSDRSIELVIHGDLTRDPAYVARLRTLAGDDPRVVLAGTLDHAGLDDFFARIDILAVPSIWYENSPMVIHEARMAGLPVLTSNFGGMAELVADGQDGVLVPPGDVAALAAQCARLAGEPGLVDRLRAHVRRPPTVADETSAVEAVYQEAVTAGR